MPDPAWPSSPPEANYLRLVGSGAAGTGTTLASAAAWQALMVGDEVAASVSTLNTAATAVNFAGVGGVASATTATGLNTALHLLAAWAQVKPPLAASAVAAYETAVSAMIPAAVSLANRAEQAADVALNPLVLGALTPAIVALDLVYFGEHWPHNASAGAAYGSALTALLPALAVPPPLAPPGASPSAPAAVAAAITETAGQTAAGEAMKHSGQIAKAAADGAAAPAAGAGQVGQLASSLMQPVQSAMQPLTGMFQAPAQALQSLSGLSGSALGQLKGLAGPAATGGAEVPTAMLTATAGPGGGSGAVVAGAAGNVSGAGVGAVPGPGLTSYTRPTSTFAPEHSGRPVGLSAGLLSVAEQRGPTTTTAGGPVPVSPAGMLNPGKGGDAKEVIVHARIVLAGDRLPKSSTG